MLEKIVKNKIVRGLALATALSGAGCVFDPPAPVAFPGDAGIDAGDATTYDARTADPDTGVYDSGVIEMGMPDVGIIDAGIPDTGYDAGQLIDAGEEDSGIADSGYDAGLPDAGIDAGYDAGVPDSGTCTPTVITTNLSGMISGQDYCFNFTGSQNYDPECGNTIQWAPGHGPNGPTNGTIVRAECGRQLVDVIYEADITDGQYTARDNTGEGVFVRQVPQGMRTSAIIVEDSMGEYGQDQFISDVQ